MALNYESLGSDKVKTFFPTDHTHTNREGAELNAQIVVEAMKQLKAAQLQNYLH